MVSFELILAARLQMQAAAADCMNGTSGDLETPTLSVSPAIYLLVEAIFPTGRVSVQRCQNGLGVWHAVRPSHGFTSISMSDGRPPA